MNRTSSELGLCAASTLLILLCPGISIGQIAQQEEPSEASSKPSGVVVENTATGAAGEKAGFQAGDILLAWERAANPPANPQAARGEILSPFDLLEAEMEQAPRGPVTLWGERNGKSIRADLPPGEWKIKARPQFPNEILALYLEGNKAADAKEIDKSMGLWKEAAEKLRNRKELLQSCWLLMKIGGASSDARRWEETQTAYDQALSLINELQRPDASARIYMTKGKIYEKQNDFIKAGEAYKTALRIREGMSAESMGIVVSLNNLGVLEWNRGDLADAEALFKRGLAITTKLAPDSLDLAISFNNLGAVAQNRGDLAGAETFLKRSLALREKLAPNSPNVARSLNNLGVLAWSRGDLAGSDTHFKRALAIFEKLTPDSLNLAGILNNLGENAWERRDLTAAESYYKRALAIQEKQAPESLYVAISLNNLGEVAGERGDLEGAIAYFKHSLAIFEQLAPNSLAVAGSLDNLGGLASRRGDMAGAETDFKIALAIREKLAPGSQYEAESLHNLGALFRKKKDLHAALDYFQRSIAALEAQRGKLGGGKEASERFSSKFADYYRDLINMQLLLLKKDDAFNILEKFRARSLLDMLAERDLDFVKDAPEALIKEQKQINFDYDRIQKQLGEISPEKEAAGMEQLLSRLRELKEKQEEVREKIKAASPKLASLQYAEPLNVKEVAGVLEPGTLFLSYCVAEKATHLFALLDGKLTAHPIFLDRDDLTKSVALHRRLLLDPTADPAALSAKGRELYALLLKPAKKEIRQAQQLLICPDGPLHGLPFAALMENKKHYLIEKMPLAYAISATVYAETRKPKAPEKNSVQLAAFGDPVYPGKERTESLDGAVRYATRIADLNPLPSTRHEVESLKDLYRDAGIFLGESATEEEAKKLGRDVPLIHFACHGILDERFPLNSGLALTIPEKVEDGKENGLLQAWEIFEGLRIDADLVTLSACQTGLGKEMGGEGLIGLTRAFQYAGARSVLSTLWSVADESTAEFMKLFYGHLKAGKPKAEALRQAQIAFIRNAERGTRNAERTKGNAEPRFTSRAPRSTLHDWSHPFYWAPFVLNGDWK